GFSVGKKENKLGLRASPTVQLAFDDMRVPGDRLLGEPGQGLAYALNSLEQARDYADQRKQFGRPIRDFEAIQFKLADMALRVTASRALLHATAAAKDRGERVTPFAAMS